MNQAQKTTINLFGIFLICLTIYGCASTDLPSNTDIFDSTNDLQNRVMLEYQQKLADCAGEGHGGFASKSACVSAAQAWRSEWIDKIIAGEQQAFEKNWETARDIRKSVENELAKKNKKVKVSVDEDGVSIEGESTSGTPQTPQGVFVGTSPIGDPVQLIDKDWTFSGSVSWSFGGVPITSDVNGVLYGVVGQSGARGMKGRMTGGSLQMLLPNGDTIALTVDTTESSLILTDATTGVGVVDFVVEADYSNAAWASVMQSSAWLRFPIIADEDGSFTVSAENVSPEDLYPHINKPYSDFNLDTMLDYNSDYQAFLVAFNQHDLRADINLDDQWTQDDIDLWITSFYDDYDNQQSAI